MKQKKAWNPKKPYSEISAKSERLALRPYVLSDFDAWHAAQAGRLKQQHEFDRPKPSKKQISREAFVEMMKRHKKKAADRKHYVFAIFDRKSGAILGSVDFYMLNHELRWGNLGYMVHNQHWGKGYGPEAARLSLKIAFGALNLYRVEAVCEPRNRASAKTAKRAGFVYEGLRKKFFPEKGGIDLIAFGMNAYDYRKQK